MDNFITIKRFTYPHELAVLQSRLEAEQIECFVKDEHTISSYPFYSNALGGLKLQVREKDLKRAKKILEEGGYLKDEEPQKPSEAAENIDRLTSNVPFLKKLPLELRVISFIMVGLTLLVLLILWMAMPNQLQKLTANGWCVDNVFFNGNYYQPDTEDSLHVLLSGMCNERMHLDYPSRQIILPGFNSPAITGAWKYENKQVEIIFTYTFNFVYKGHYDVKFNGDNLMLRSPYTTIYCSKDFY